MIDALQRQAAAWLAAGTPAMLVQVVAHKGSVPRETGTRMLVSADQVLGTIGGGHLELQAIRLARQRLQAGLMDPDDRHYPLGPALGQCCGGALTLRTSGLSAQDLASWPATPPLFHLQLYGAGHVGRAIVRLLASLPCQVDWIDEREAEFPPLPDARDATDAAHVQRCCVEPVDAEVRNAPAGCCYLVLTHSHALDMAITEAILRRGDFAYLGLIGSLTKRARFVHRFEQRGIPAEALSRLTCPIGIPGIAGKTPEVIAVAVVAQLLQQAQRRSA